MSQPLFTQRTTKTVTTRSTTQRLAAEGNHIAAALSYLTWVAWCGLWAYVWFGTATENSAGVTRVVFLVLGILSVLALTAPFRPRTKRVRGYVTTEL